MRQGPSMFNQNKIDGYIYVIFPFTLAFAQ